MDECRYETYIELCVDFVKPAGRGRVIGAISVGFRTRVIIFVMEFLAGALDKQQVLFNERDDLALAELGKGSDLKLGYIGWRRSGGRFRCGCAGWSGV